MIVFEELAKGFVGPIRLTGHLLFEIVIDYRFWIFVVVARLIVLTIREFKNDEDEEK